MASSVTVTPSAGHAPVATQGGVGTSPGYDAVDLRRLASVGAHEGVIGAGSWLVTQRGAGANMSVDVAASTGPAVVQGDSITDQGLYYVPAHSAVINVDIATADGSNPRIDRVVLEVKDDAHDSGGANLARVRVISGTPTSGATVTNLSGAAAVPSSALLLANVVVGTSASSITTANCADVRVQGATSAAGYRTILQGTNKYPASQSGTRVFNASSADLLPVASLVAPHAIALAVADYSVGGTARLRVKVTQTVYTTATDDTFTVGLYPYTVSAGAMVLGGVISGSTVAFASTGANTATSGSSGDFAFPSDGNYVLAVANSGTNNTSVPDFTAILQVHAV